MKIKIYEPEAREKEVHVALFSDDNGVVLVAVDPKTGERLLCGNILWIQPDGTIARAQCVGEDIGFSLDFHGRVKIDS